MDKKTFVAALASLAIGGVLGSSADKIPKPENNTYFNTSTNIDEEIEAILDSYLQQYINENLALTEQKNTLESEIAKLKKQREELMNNETYDVKKLLVVEYSFEANKQKLWILYNEYFGCEEVFGRFEASHGLHPEDPNDHKYDELCSRYVHLYPENTQPLVNYLTDDRIAEIDQSGGRITKTTLKEIEKEINKEYNKKNQASSVPTALQR